MTYGGHQNASGQPIQTESKNANVGRLLLQLDEPVYLVFIFIYDCHLNFFKTNKTDWVIVKSFLSQAIIWTILK